jgi:hypothetical protein
VQGFIKPYGIVLEKPQLIKQQLANPSLNRMDTIKTFPLLEWNFAGFDTVQVRKSQ